MFSSDKEVDLRIVNFSMEREGTETLASTTYSFPRGRVGVFLGNSEGQKRHFLHCLGGFEKSYMGDIVACGQVARSSDSAFKRHVFLVSPHVQFNIPCALSHVPGVLMAFYKHWDFEAYRSWLDYFSLPYDVPHSQLSIANKMRALVCVAMASGAEVLIFEDIDVYLNGEQQQSLLSSLTMKCRTGTTAFIGSKRISRWVSSDVDLYGFKDAQLIRVDGGKLRDRLGQSDQKPKKFKHKRGRNSVLDDEWTSTRTLTFVGN